MSATNACVNFYERNVGTPFSHILVEQYFIVNLSNERTGKGYALQGYIDRLQLADSSQPASHDPADLGNAIRASRDGRLIIVDYKSGYKHIPQHALNLDTQFSCYDSAADVLYPYMDRTFAVEEVRDGHRIQTTTPAKGSGGCYANASLASARPSRKRNSRSPRICINAAVVRTSNIATACKKSPTTKASTPKT